MKYTYHLQSLRVDGFTFDPICRHCFPHGIAFHLFQISGSLWGFGSSTPELAELYQHCPWCFMPVRDRAGTNTVYFTMEFAWDIWVRMKVASELYLFFFHMQTDPSVSVKQILPCLVWPMVMSGKSLSWDGVGAANGFMCCWSSQEKLVGIFKNEMKWN